MTNRFDKIDEFLIHIATFALSNPYFEITDNFVYGQMIKYNIKDEKKILDVFSYFEDKYKYRTHLHAYRENNWKYYLQLVNGKEDFINKKALKIYIPQDRKHIKKSAELIFDFLNKNKIKHLSKISEDIRCDNISIRLLSLEDANLLSKFIDETDEIKKGLIDPNPFTTEYKNIAYIIDDKVPYLYDTCFYISEYINDLRKNNKLHQVSYVDFNNFLNNIYANVFNKGEKLINYCEKRNIINNKIGKLISHRENLELLLIALNPNKNINYTFAHFRWINSEQYKKDINKFMKDLLYKSFNEDEVTKPILTLKQKEKLLVDAILKTTKKYTLDHAIKAVKKYLKNNDPSGFTRDDDIRLTIINYLPSAEVVLIIKNSLDGEFDLERYINNAISINIDKLKQEILEKACIQTYGEFGETQFLEALREAITKKNYKKFSNKAKARENLIRYINPKDLPQIMKQALLDVGLPGAIVQENYTKIYIELINKTMKKMGC